MFFHSGIPEQPWSKIQIPSDKLHDKVYLIQKSEDVALDNGLIRLVLGNFTNHTARP
jgi:hypothetical protein